MTKRSLRNSVLIVAGSFLAVAGLAAVLKATEHGEMYNYIKDFSPLLLGIGAAYLAYSFQRRMAFLTSLRDLWKEITETKNILIRYTNKKLPTEEEYDAAEQKLFNTIDLVRAVFINVKEDKNRIGFYPFEPLHDMRRTFAKCRPATATGQMRKQARGELETAWYSLKRAFLQEFPRATPLHPVTKRRSRDPRLPIPEAPPSAPSAA